MVDLWFEGGVGRVGGVLFVEGIASDGAGSACRCVRAGPVRAVIVAEPLHLRSGRLSDGLKRAFEGEAPSGTVPPFHVVMNENAEFAGGPNSAFDLESRHREAREGIRSVQ